MNRATPRQSMYIKLKDDLGIYIYYVHDMNLTPELSARIREHNFLKPCGVTPSFTIAHMADFIVNNSVEPLTKNRHGATTEAMLEAHLRERGYEIVEFATIESK